MLSSVCSKAKVVSRPTWRPHQRNHTMHRVILLAASVSLCACTNTELCLVSHVQHLKVAVKGLG